MANISNAQTAELMRFVSEVRDAVLQLQKLAIPTDPVAVRSCTSCLSDSCNKPLELASPVTPRG